MTRRKAGRRAAAVRRSIVHVRALRCDSAYAAQTCNTAHTYICKGIVQSYSYRALWRPAASPEELQRNNRLESRKLPNMSQQIVGILPWEHKKRTKP